MIATLRTACTALLLSISLVSQAQMPESWSQPQKPFKVFGNTYYVGTRGLSAVLITSDQGHVLLDGALPDSAPAIIHNVRALGFRIEDVKLILNSHNHFDHAGGIAALQKRSGAQVAASEASAKVLRSGEAGSDDPQFGQLPKMEPIANVRTFKHGEVLTVGKLALKAHLTPGHTSGGTSWTWQSCEQSRCLNMAYVDSLNPVSAPGYLYSDSKRKPNNAQLLESSHAVVNALPCDVLIAPHPEFADLLGKLARREAGNKDAFVDNKACRAYVDMSRERLVKRLAEEAAAKR